MADNDTDFVKQCIEKYRSRLLDTSNRNKLISFDHGERSRQHIRVIDELPDFLYNKFLDGRKLTFKALPQADETPRDENTPEFRLHLGQAKLKDDYIKEVESVDEDDESAQDRVQQIDRALRNRIREELGLPVWQAPEELTNTEIARKHNINPSYEMPDAASEDQRYVDKFIQTLLKPEEMERKLSDLTSYITMDIQESGINTLYVAFGFLEWYRAANSRRCISPLLLLQLEIEKRHSKKGYQYHVEATGEEAEINLSLSEALKNDFGIKLPEFTGEDRPEDYMQKVSECIQNFEAHVPKKEKWRVRRFITVGRFHFARLVMFRDLSDTNNNVSSNDTVKALFSGNNPGADHCEDYDIDTSEVENTVPLLITSADASQHSALFDVMKGNNLVIEGPPGTGKSQTITNIIANMLQTGKSVLFLAEKMAALNVVYGRLSEVDLDPYCLELHSTKTKKTEVLKSIEKRLKLPAEPDDESDLDAKKEEFNRCRQVIREYVNVLNSNFGRQNKPIHDYLWGAQLRKDRMGDLCPIINQCQIAFEQADLSANDLKVHTGRLEKIAVLKRQVDAESNNAGHPWGFVGATDLNPFQQDELKSLVNEWRDKLETVLSDLRAFNEMFDLPIGNAAQDIKVFYDDLSALIDYDAGTLNEVFIANLENKENAVALVDFVERIHGYRSVREKIQSIHDLSTTIDNLKEIETQTRAAEAIGVHNITAADMQAHVENMEEELQLWRENLNILINIGKQLDVVDNENMGLGKVYALLEALDDIVSVPRDYFCLRSEDIINGANARCLEEAADSKESILASQREQEKDYDLSMMGQPYEIRVHAAVLDNVGFLRVFKPSYRQAKNLVKLASRYKRKFDSKRSASDLRAIADAKEEKDKFEQDVQLRTICGALFQGIQTDFKKFHEINEWACRVRRRYTFSGAFSRKVRCLLLEGDMDDIDSVRELASSDSFAALKKKVVTIRDEGNAAPDTPIEQYLCGLSKKYKALKSLKNHLENTAINEMTTFADIARDLPYLQSAREIRNATINNTPHTVEKIFDDVYRDVETDIEDIKETTHFIKDCLTIPKLKESFNIFLNQNFAKTWKGFKEQLQSLKDVVDSAIDTVSKINDCANICFGTTAKKRSWLDVDLEDLAEELSEALRKPDTLDQWLRFNGARAEVAETISGQILQVYERENLDFETLPAAFEYIVYRAVLHEIYRRNPVLSQTRGMTKLEQARATVNKLDTQIRELQQRGLCHRLNVAKTLPGNGSGPRNTWTEEALIHHEINKKRRHIPIRDIIKRAGESIQAIKPCFLMSPLAVAQYLEPGGMTFDLVIIDEASQMRPEDALGAIARARQLVVVGDSKQLPPTSFFQVANDDGTAEEDEDVNAESIMDKALSSLRPVRTLSRHYRSQHDSLIAFSNYQFYDNRLVLFPSPVKNPDVGLQLQYINGTYGASVNIDEVEAVVKAAVDFMKKHPERSLGIATMNQQQRGLIEDEMALAFAECDDAKEYERQWRTTLEPFFVKKLENVQGDERDAIFISTVYGPDENGVVRQRFGPINRVGGHRRLNVLFSRAKKNMVVFSSLKPEDIKINGAASEGIQALKGFLTYAKTGVIDASQRDPEVLPDSDFEVFFKEKLESIGCAVHPQVGQAGYRIDLGVKHPKYPYGYLMGIECDGATYHSSRSARERDIIRQQVLERLGWRIYRIWSTDWFYNPIREFEKLKNSIQQALLDHRQDPPAENEVIEPDSISGKEGEGVDGLCEAAAEQNNADIVELFDRVTYFEIKDDGEEIKRAVQIVPHQGNANTGTINKDTPVGKALLGACEGEQIMCVLPMGEVRLQVVTIDRNE